MVSIGNLDFCYHRNKKLFDGLTMKLNGGSIYGLLGKNGAGKSTLLKNIAGLVYPSGGKVEVMGRDPQKREAEFLKEVCFVAEEFYLPPLKIKQFLKLNVPFYSKFDLEYFNALLKEFDVPTNQQLLKMSYGQKKKFLIAFGLATNVQLLIMDEPTNGLDIPSKKQFRKVMAAALNDNRCIVISTHQVRDLDHLIDTVIIIDEGKIAMKANVDEITEKLYFKNTNQLDDTIIYAEQSIFGFNAILPNYHQEDSKLDIELLFNAVLAEKNKITPFFK